MKWIKLKDRKPSVAIDGEKILIYRILNNQQECMSINIHDTKMVKYCNEDETWWMSLPDKPSESIQEKIEEPQDRYCKGCHANVTNTMYCHCGEIPLTKESTYNESELPD